MLASAVWIYQTSEMNAYILTALYMLSLTAYAALCIFIAQWKLAVQKSVYVRFIQGMMVYVHWKYLLMQQRQMS